MTELHIDIETYSAVDLMASGVYPYANDPSFKIILFAYAFDDEDVEVIDTYYDEYPGESIPPRVWKALTDPNVKKIAQNANFEITCISAYYGLDLDPGQWFCTMVASAYLGLPLNLDKIAQVLGLDAQKDAKGKALIKYFSMPCKPTKVNGGRTVNEPTHDPEKWQEFINYNAQDVRVEIEICKYLERFDPMPAIEWAYWAQDQQINRRGVYIDREFIEAAIAANEKFLKEVFDEMVELTGNDNPNSLAQLKSWLKSKLGYEVGSLAKDQLGDLLASDSIPPVVARVLELRQLSSKTSVSKYATMLAYAGDDDRIRGLLQFYGANRTGRFSGRGVQVQNLKRTLSNGLETAKEAIRLGVADLLYDDVPDVISKLVRTALIAPEGKSFAVSDFAAIEARVLAWIAGEDWVIEVFNTHGKLYEATASKMFNVPLEMIKKGSDLRSKGKVASLALGYQGGAGALVQMGALRQGLEENELPAIVKSWRSANPSIVKFWRECEQAAKHVITKKTSYLLRKKYTSLKFHYEKGYLFITLPSGRRLSYYGAAVEGNKLTYWGIDQTKKIWVKGDTYGGSLVENITQAIARDCLVDSMYRMRHLAIIMHIHDEIVVEADEDKVADTLVEMEKIMCVSPAWAAALPLEGDGYTSKYYKKD